MIDQLLCLCFGQCAVCQVTFDVDIEEGRYTSDRHRRTVLGLDRCQVRKVQPLEGLVCVLGRLTDVIAVDGSHLFHAVQRLDLLSQFLALADDVVRHRATAAVGFVFFLLFDQIIDTV